MGAELSWKRDAELRRNFRELNCPPSSTDAPHPAHKPFLGCQGVGCFKIFLRKSDDVNSSYHYSSERSSLRSHAPLHCSTFSQQLFIFSTPSFD